MLLCLVAMEVVSSHQGENFPAQEENQGDVDTDTEQVESRQKTLETTRRFSTSVDRLGGTSFIARDAFPRCIS